MENARKVRVGTTTQKTHSATKLGFGFDIETTGSGPLAGEWLPVLTLIYANESDSHEAEAALKQAIKNPVYAEGHKLP